MTRRTITIIVGVVVAVVAVGVIWWLAAPLFINTTVDEAFPFETLPDPETVADMSEDEIAELRDQIAAAVPSEDEMADMPEDVIAAAEERLMAVSAEMPPVEADEDMPEDMPDEPVVLSAGEFVDADAFHRGSGSATIYELPEGGNVLRFEEFSVTNGPDLHVILSSNPEPTSRADIGDDYVDLGQLKGNMGNQNYDIPADVDLSNYQSIVIYCLPFHVVFSTATLSGA